jgi:hypothetical protein
MGRHRSKRTHEEAAGLAAGASRHFCLARFDRGGGFCGSSGFFGHIDNPRAPPRVIASKFACTTRPVVAIAICAAVFSADILLDGSGVKTLFWQRASYVLADNTPVTPHLRGFLQDIGQTQYWRDAVGDFGVGTLVGEEPVQAPAGALSGKSPGVDDIHKLLEEMLDTDSPPWGKPDPNKAFILVFPEGVSAGIVLCSAYMAWHSAHRLPTTGVNIQYIIAGMCSDHQPGAWTPEMSLTMILSHELQEMVTNPRSEMEPESLGFIFDDGQELSDQCHSSVNGKQLALIEANHTSYAVQRQFFRAQGPRHPIPQL